MSDIPRKRARNAVNRLSKQMPLPDRDSCFRFLDLPAELRLNIYRDLLPSDMEIKFALHAESAASRAVWRALIRPTVVLTKPSDYVKLEAFGLSLFLVNKEVSNEARAVLYGDNTFALQIDGMPHEPVSLQSPLIFGPLGLPHRLPLIRSLRRISITVSLPLSFRPCCPDHWTMARHRARLSHFVDVLKQHADDENQKSLLKSLHITFVSGRHQTVDDHMFALDSLASLKGVEKVQIEGVQDWFKQCLELCIKGEGGEVEEVDWPLMRVRRRKSGRMKQVWVTTKRWYSPTLNWREYAVRNGIALPVDIESYFASDD